MRRFGGLFTSLGMLGLGVLLAGASCGQAERPPDPVPQEPAGPSFRLGVITDLEGTLEPCGCTSRPLGGIDRMASRVRSLNGDGVPMLLVAAGSLLFDGLSHGDVESGAAGGQEVLEAQTLAGILGRIGLTAATLGRADLSQGLTALGEATRELRVPLLAEGLTVGTGEAASRLAEPRIERLGGVAVGIFGVADLRGPDGSLPEGVTAAGDPRQWARRAAEALRRQGAEVVVALVSGDRRTARQVAAAIGGPSFVILGGVSSAEPIPPFSVGESWVLSAGRQGQRLLVVDVFRRGDGAFADASEWTRAAQQEHLRERINDLRERIAQWEQAGTAEATDMAGQRARLERMERELAALERTEPAAGNRFEARLEELAPDSTRDREIYDVMAELDRRVNEHNREAFADLVPAPAPPGQARYVGTAACRRCHERADRWWRGTPHGRAYATLVDRSKEFNLSCVGCHVTGYGQPGGSTVTHNLEGALVDVGCESCHGPASRHVARARQPGLVTTEVPESVCVGCHTPEHSDLFDYEEYRSRLIVRGHGRPPGAAGDDEDDDDHGGADHDD